MRQLLAIWEAVWAFLEPTPVSYTHLDVYKRQEQHQATMINWLISADHSPLETTIAYEQVAIEVTASVAENLSLIHI